MIDIHSHIIPNVDDGARSVEETFNILKEAQEAGFTDVILTSHFLLNYYETNAQELIFWKEKLQEVLKKQGTKINLQYFHNCIESSIPFQCILRQYLDPFVHTYTFQGEQLLALFPLLLNNIQHSQNI